MSHGIFIALGSNLGDRLANLKAAQAGFSPAMRILACSPVYETPPWGYQDQPAFLNQVVKVETDMPPLDLLVYLKRLEHNLGRQQTFRYGPRLIDLDLLFYDELVLESPDLSLPHPRLSGRAFVLVPLADLAPDFRHPVLGKTVREMLSEANRDGVNLYE